MLSFSISLEKSMLVTKLLNIGKTSLRTAGPKLDIWVFIRSNVVLVVRSDHCTQLGGQC